MHAYLSHTFSYHMLRWTIRIVFAFSFLFLLACNRHANELAIENTNIEDEIALQQNLVFTFNHDVVPDSVLNKWDTTQVVKLVPAVRGRFKWTAKNEITFSPTTGFAPSTDYKATVNPAMKAIVAGLSVSSELIAFHTPYLALQSAQPQWAAGQIEGSVALRLLLNFNYPVAIDGALKAIKIKHIKIINSNI